MSIHSSGKPFCITFRLIYKGTSISQGVIIKRHLLLAVLLITFIAGCRQAGFIKPDNVLLARPGLHRLSDGRTLVVGTLRYRDKNGGYWAVVPDSNPRGPFPKALATFTDTSSININLRPLDGQYVLVEGTASAAKPPSISVDILQLVVDVVRPYRSNVFKKPGLYTLERGETLARGWLDHRGIVPLEGWVITNKHPEGNKHAGKVLVELTNLTNEDERRFEAGSFVDMKGSVTGKAPLGPAFEKFDSWGSSPPGSSHSGEFKTGVPPRWRHVERPGLKDLPGGRKRLVGVFHVDVRTKNLAEITVLNTLPFEGGIITPVAGSVDLRTIASSLPRSSSEVQSIYAAAEGKITSSRPNPDGTAEAPHMKAESFSVVTTMTVAPNEQYP